MEANLEREESNYAVRLSADDGRSLGLSKGQTVEVLPRLPDGVATVSAFFPGRRIMNGIPIYTIDEMVAEARPLGPDFEPPTVDWGPDVGSEIIDDDAPY